MENKYVSEDGVPISSYLVKMETELLIPDFLQDEVEMRHAAVKEETDFSCQVDEKPSTFYSLSDGIPNGTKSGNFKFHYCEFTTATKSTLRKQQISGHLEDKSHVCMYCGYTTFIAHKLKLHIMRKHKLDSEKHFICNECGKGFAESSCLTVHMRSHTGEKPFKCKECSKGFTSRGHLTVHMRCHSGEKPYKCKECEKRFAHSSHLTVHNRIHTGEKPFKCIECGKVFKTSDYLRVHMRFHTGEKPFKCKACNKGFAHSSHLTVHKRIHTGEKPFKCLDCGKGFREKGHMTAHMRCHTGEKPF